MDAAKLTRYVELVGKIKALEAESAELSGLKTQLEKELLTDFERDGFNSVKCNGHTIFLHRQLWASAMDGDHARLNLALRAAGLAELVEERVNAHRLSAYVRGEEAEGRELTTGLKEAVRVSEVFQIRVRTTQ